MGCASSRWSLAVLLGIVIVGAPSCGGTTIPAQEYLPGVVTFGHEVRSFRPCGSEGDFWVVDSAGILWDLHRELAPGQEPFEEVFATVSGVVGPRMEDGFGTDYEGTVFVDEVLYAATEGYGCQNDWNNFSYRALGNEPFWSLEITPLGLELNRLGLGTQSWTLEHEEHEEGVITFTGQNAGGKAIEVRFSGEPCRDSMAGAFFGFSVEILTQGEQLRGCGLRGPLPG